MPFPFTLLPSFHAVPRTPKAESQTPILAFHLYPFTFHLLPFTFYLF
ncbi:hypothetical protein D1AOALGA4SA_9429 [Olavius algarvensis Delta 1 endosymbiont]|nr:hypothetical protein D1AOALGA4SA_9429 [Olavius algarvensis Delta 1 endosymbiont]